MTSHAAIGRILIVTALVAIGAGGALAFCEHRILWGYWLRPETILTNMKTDRVEWVSQLVESVRGELEPDPGVTDLSRMCGASALDSCVEGETILELFGKSRVPPSITGMGDADRSVWEAVWEVVRSHNRHANPSGLGTPASGVAAHFTSVGRTYEWVMYSTHEIEDDWHRSVQVLCALDGSRPTLVRWSSYRYQIAGLEDTPMWLLWIVNSAMFAFAYLSLKLDVRAKQFIRNLNLIGSVLLFLIGLALGLAGLFGAHEHDPWLVILLMTATVAIVSSVYAAIRSI